MYVGGCRRFRRCVAGDRGVQCCSRRIVMQYLLMLLLFLIPSLLPLIQQLFPNFGG